MVKPEQVYLQVNQILDFFKIKSKTKENTYPFSPKHEQVEYK